MMLLTFEAQKAATVHINPSCTNHRGLSKQKSDTNTLVLRILPHGHTLNVFAHHLKNCLLSVKQECALPQSSLVHYQLNQ